MHLRYSKRQCYVIVAWYRAWDIASQWRQQYVNTVPVCACPFSIAMQLRIALTLTTPICIHLLYSVKLGQPRSVKAFPTLSAPRPIISPLRDKSITKKINFSFFSYELLRIFHKNQFYITLKFESYNRIEKSSSRRSKSKKNCRNLEIFRGSKFFHVLQTRCLYDVKFLIRTN